RIGEVPPTPDPSPPFAARMGGRGGLAARAPIRSMAEHVAGLSGPEISQNSGSGSHHPGAPHRCSRRRGLSNRPRITDTCRLPLDSLPTVHRFTQDLAFDSDSNATA